jgi:hypothetical protein
MLSQNKINVVKVFFFFFYQKIKIKVFFYLTIHAFDLLKNRGLNWTTFVVLCLIQKLIKRLDKRDSKGLDKNKIFCPPLNHRTTFWPQYNYKKYENIHFMFEYKKYYRSIFLQYNFVLFCILLLCDVLSSICWFSNQTETLTQKKGLATKLIIINYFFSHIIG